MVADSNSQIAWHRAQIRKHRETLKHLETARFSFGEIAGSKTIDQRQETVAELKRKIRDSEQIIAAYEKPAASHDRLPNPRQRSVEQLERPRLFQHLSPRVQAQCQPQPSTWPTGIKRIRHEDADARRRRTSLRRLRKASCFGRT
jgi:hypothetical protein